MWSDLNLKPERMSRVRIIASSSMKNDIVSALHDSGVIQIEPVSQELGKLLLAGKPDESYRKVNSLLQRFRGYETALPPSEVSKKASFDRQELLSDAESLNLDVEISTLKRREDDLLSEKKQIENRILAVDSLGNFNLDLGILNGSNIASYVVSGMERDAMKSIISRLNPLILYPITEESLLVSIRRGDDSELARIASDNGLSILHIPEMSGTIDVYRPMLLRRLEENSKSLGQVADELKSLSSKYWERIVQIREQLEIENRKLEISEKFLKTEDTFVMEGWIPRRKFQSMSRLLEKVSRSQVIVREISSNEEPPTLFNNPRKFRFYEFFVRFYSLPQESEIDPTLIFGLIFPFFFGLMVGDWGYGIAILLLSIWMSKKLNSPNPTTILPKRLTSFALTIFGKGPLRVLAKTLMVGSVVAIVFGILFNSFFGFPLLPVTVFELISGFAGAHIGAFPPHPLVLIPQSVMVPKLLLISGYIGLAMVSFGLVLGFINEYYRRHRAGMVSRVGWILVSWGFALLGLALIHHDLSLSGSGSTQTLASLGMIIAGVATVIATERATGAIEVLSIISHILSYTRILGILLASVILSEVIDLIFMKGVEKSPLLAVVGIIILIFGQIFNLVIAVFEPGIQGARLLYVEFFSKFYRGNGHYFRPFGSSRKYTVPKYSIDEETGKN